MDHISDLLYKKIIGRISPEELEELQRWATTDARRRLLETAGNYDKMASVWKRRALVDRTRPMEEMQRRISRVERSSRLWRYAAAAAVAVVLGVAATFIVRVSNVDLSENMARIEQVDSFDNIKPGTAKATLTTGNGNTIALAGNGSNIITEKMRQSADSSEGDTQELCLDVPRGGEYMVMLEDSTKVWLNSQSQLRCPAYFAENERRVKVTGEVYFEVSHDEKRPFYVETDDQVIRVYGTKFNVKAYEDEETVYTTLESGSISLTRSGSSDGELFLEPGHQARLNIVDKKIELRAVDAETVTGWRNGQFVFEEQRLEDIMRDLSRWYNFEYRFETTELRNVVFKGTIDRYSDFMTALAIIETSGNIAFSMDKGCVVITRK